MLNEPLPHERGDRHAGALVELYRELTAAIRAVDPDHLISHEDTHWSTNWAVMQEPYDPNSLLQFHKYWSPPDRASIARDLETGQRFGVPIYMGEGGEDDLAWLQTAVGLFDDLGDLVELVAMEEARHENLAPLSCRPRAGPRSWHERRARSRQPSRDVAAATLDALLEGMERQACEERPEVVAALFHRAPIRLGAEAFTAGAGGGTPT